MHRDYGEYFTQVYAPVLFFCGIFSVVLTAMQVGLQASDMREAKQILWVILRGIGFWFAKITLLYMCAIAVSGSFLLGVVLIRKSSYAAKDLLRRESRSNREIDGRDQTKLRMDS